MKTENDLHKAVVKYIRNNLPKFIILIPGLGEFQRNEILKRSAYLKGYRPGSPDLIILTPNGEYNGLAIEFKNQKNKLVIRDNQREFLHDLETHSKFKTMASNSCDEITKLLHEYHDAVNKTP